MVYFPGATLAASYSFSSLAPLALVGLYVVRPFAQDRKRGEGLPQVKNLLYTLCLILDINSRNLAYSMIVVPRSDQKGASTGL